MVLFFDAIPAVERLLHGLADFVSNHGLLSAGVYDVSGPFEPLAVRLAYHDLVTVENRTLENQGRHGSGSECVVRRRGSAQTEWRRERQNASNQSRKTVASD